MKKNIGIKKAGKNQKFQAAFLKHFEDFFVEKESGDAYVEQVQDAFWDATLEGDWVNFSAQSRLSSEIYDVVETARKFIARGNPEPAIEIGFTIIENGIDLINHNDDRGLAWNCCTMCQNLNLMTIAVNYSKTIARIVSKRKSLAVGIGISTYTNV